MIKWERLQKEQRRAAVKRMDRWEGWRSPLSTNTKGEGNGFERRVGEGSVRPADLTREKKKEEDWERQSESVRDSNPELTAGHKS